MRKLFIVAAACMALAASCSTNHGKCVINGTITDSLAVAEGASVVLCDRDGEIARSEIKDGAFSIVAPVDETKSCFIYLSAPGSEIDNSGALYVACEPCELSVDFGSCTITGGPVSEALNKLQLGLMEKSRSIQDAYSKAYFAGDYALADSLSEAGTAELYALSAETYENNLDNVAGMQALSFLFAYKDLSYADAQELVSKAADFIQDDEMVKRTLEALKAAEASGVGSSFIEIEGKDINGEAAKLSDYVAKGKYVLIDFWASWCGPCMQAVPTVRGLQEKYGDKGFQLVGINCWEQKAEDGPAKAALMDMTWPVIFAEDESVEAYGVQAIPTLILFDPEGVIVERFLGEEGLEEGVAKYFE